MTPGELRALVNADRVGTHWEDCWKSHRDCAILRAADAWDKDKALARLYRLERDVAEAQVDRIANGIAVLGEQNGSLRKVLKMLTFSPDGCPDTWPSPEAVAAVLLEMPFPNLCRTLPAALAPGETKGT